MSISWNARQHLRQDVERVTAGETLLRCGGMMGAGSNPYSRKGQMVRPRKLVIALQHFFRSAEFENADDLVITARSISKGINNVRTHYAVETRYHYKGQRGSSKRSMEASKFVPWITRLLERDNLTVFGVHVTYPTGVVTLENPEVGFLRYAQNKNRRGGFVVTNKETTNRVFANQHRQNKVRAARYLASRIEKAVLNPHTELGRQRLLREFARVQANLRASPGSSNGSNRNRNRSPKP